MSIAPFSFACVASALLAVWAPASFAGGACPEEPVLENWTGGGTVLCPCFVVGEEAGVVLEAPAAHYPIEITKIRIGWGSVFGGSPQVLEQSLNIYPSGLPNPGARQFSLPGPVLTDGFINEFDISVVPGNKIINSGPFSISLEFANASPLLGPSVVHDGNGCQGSKNTVKAIPGGWSDACVLGVSGDWVMSVVYRRVNCNCTTTATWANYGLGHPGTFGFPLLSSTANPVLGSPINLFLSNSLGAQTPALLFLGLAPASVPGSWGSDLLLVPTLTLGLSLPQPGLLIPLTIPVNPNLCGVSIYLQALERDAGASRSVSATAGLELLLGI